jgi:hypothetical protein
MKRGGLAASWAGYLCRRAAFVALVVSLSLFARAARADDPEIQASVDTQRLGVGEVLRLSMHVASQRAQPSNPSISGNPGFTVVGTSSGPSQQVTITNGRMVTQRGLDVVWTLRADKVGTWSIGPVNVQVGSGSYRAGPVRITVVPAGKGPPRAPGPDPFDPFGGAGGFDPFRGLLDSLNAPGAHDRASVDPKLALDAPLGAVAFLHAIVDTTNVVVGQQVTVALYLYVDTSVRDPGMVDIHEATAADFVKRVLFEDDNSDRGVSRAIVGGHLFSVRLLRKWALFPIKAGDLEVTPMDLTLQRNHAAGDPSRKSELITVHVTEPPLAHRPPGYTLGDVGSFSLSGDVSPREVEEGGAVGVTLTLSGSGNLPSMITPPAQAGLEWLTPEVHEKVGPMPSDRDVFGGTRTFTYVLRVHKAGEARLGLLSLPYWDPVANKYEVAHTDLGRVLVRPSTAPKVEKDTPPDPFSALPDVRGEMGHTRVAPSQLAEEHPMLLWFALSATPLSFVVFSGVARVVKVVRERRAERAASPETELKTKLALAEQAMKANDARALSSATARALEAAAVVYAEASVRDALEGEAKERLVAAGVDEVVAGKVDRVLVECALARFSPEEPDLGVARARWASAKDAIQAMKRGS